MEGAVGNLNFHLSPQGLNSIFDAFFASRPVVFWIRSMDWYHQLYISKKYEDLWGHSTNQIYEHPLSWREYIAAPSRKEQEKVWAKCMVNERCLVYAIHHPEKGLRWIRDANFPLYDVDNHLIAHAGIAEDITQELESNDIKVDKAVLDATINPEYKTLIEIIVRELKVMPHPDRPSGLSHIQADKPLIISGRTTQLSAREVECIQLLYEVGSAKHVAKELNISYRTVEKHIENIKQKLECRTQLELLTQLQEAIF